jgi:membrane protein DedA with SNARE-associated domain
MPTNGVVAALASILSSSSTTILGLISSYGYISIILLMTLEGTSLPIPSEVVAPVTGYLAAQGLINPYLGFLALLIGNTFGMMIAYAIGYFIEKKLVYKHLKFFHIKQHSLDAFDSWFARNGAFAVFISRMIPEVRGIMSFPAGFAKMPLPKFLFWSVLGSAIWDGVLMAFGYYLHSTSSIVWIMAAISIFIIALYVIYAMFIRSTRKRRI